jgi:hypothetical protein
MSKKMSNEDRSALLDSEVYQNFEQLQLRKYAQNLSDKIVNSPSAQKAISDGIAKALTTNSEDDGKMESVHDELKSHLKKLTDHELFEMSDFFADELKARGIDAGEYEKTYEDEEAGESPEDEIEEEQDMESVLAFVKSSLTKLAYSAADKGNTEAAYLIERCLQRIS